MEEITAFINGVWLGILILIILIICAFIYGLIKNEPEKSGLVDCPDCGLQISTKAKTCPHCGRCL